MGRPSGRPAAPARGGAGLERGEAVLVVAVLVAAALCWCSWCAAGVGTLLTHGRFEDVAFSRTPESVLGLLAHPSDPSSAYPRPWRSKLAPPALYYLVFGAAGVSIVLLWCAARAAVLRASRWATPDGTMTRVLRRWRVEDRVRRSDPPPEPLDGAWASRRDLAPLKVRAGSPGRLVLGSAGRWLVATERAHSVLVLGPTQSMKTTGFAVPALLEWKGPVVATSVKSDLVRSTAAWRATQGNVAVFDPLGVTGAVGSSWSPLGRATSWEGARKAAAALCGVARADGSGMQDAAFWYAAAEKLLAPLLFAAAVSGASMDDVVRWIDTEEIDEIEAALRVAGVPAAWRAAEASFHREDRQRSSIYATADTIVAAYSDPVVAASSRTSSISAHQLLDGSASSLFICAPAHEQERLQTIFSALLAEVLDAAIEQAAARGAPLDPPLLVLLDEAANIAPLRELDRLASLVAAHGVQLVTIWQDLAQIEARYGVRAATVLNNHRAKIVLSGVSDPSTLEQLSRLVGEARRPVTSVTIDPSGGRSSTISDTAERLAPGDLLRRLAPGTGVLIYGHLRPIKLRLRPYFSDPVLRHRAGA